MAQPPKGKPSNAAAQLDKTKRDAERWFYGMAEEEGVRAQFETIVNAVRVSGLHVRFQNNWQVAAFTPVWNKNILLVEMLPNLDYFVHLDRFSDAFGYSALDVEQAIGGDGPVWRDNMSGGSLSSADVPAWLERFRDLLNRRDLHKKMPI